MFGKLFNYHAYNVPVIGIHKLAFPVDRNVGRNSSRIFTSFIDRANSQFVTNLKRTKYSDTVDNFTAKA